VALRFKLDENIPGEAIALLRDAGHDVATALEEELGGAADERVLRACRDEGRVLVTLDLDFADIRAYPPASHAGVWVLRPDVQSVAIVVGMLRGALALTGAESVSSRLWVVEPGQVRIRE
jgi:predicted nuclease of predicted toxin-antitoxin system